MYLYIYTIVNMIFLHNYIILVFIFLVTIIYYKLKYTYLVGFPIVAYYHIIIVYKYFSCLLVCSEHIYLINWLICYIIGTYSYLSIFIFKFKQNAGIFWTLNGCSHTGWPLTYKLLKLSTYIYVRVKGCINLLYAVVVMRPTDKASTAVSLDTVDLVQTKRWK